MSSMENDIQKKSDVSVEQEGLCARIPQKSGEMERSTPPGQEAEPVDLAPTRFGDCSSVAAKNRRGEPEDNTANGAGAVNFELKAAAFAETMLIAATIVPEERDFEARIQNRVEYMERELRQTIIDEAVHAEAQPVQKPLYKHWSLWIGLILVLAGIGTAIGVIFAQKPKPNTLQSREHAIRTRLRNELAFDFEQAGTPHQEALDWILYWDPLGLNADDVNLVQRYLMALFYSQTSNMGASQWRSCYPSVLKNDEACIFIQPENNTTTFRWLSGMHECNWAGVTCSEANNTEAIELSAQNLSGTLPTEILGLPLLQSITLPFNEMNGTLSAVFGNKIFLKILNLQGNCLEGTIPTEVWNLSNLTTLELRGNQLSGTISTKVGKLQDLQLLSLGANKFTGMIPTEVGNLQNLRLLGLDANEFTGTIPTEVGKLRHLQQLWLGANKFTGTIPDEIGNLVNLVQLRLSFNNFTSDSYPDAIDGFNALSNFTIGDSAINQAPLKNILKTFSDDADFDDQDSDQYKAFIWLEQEHHEHPRPDYDYELFERYAALVLYYATAGATAGKSSWTDELGFLEKGISVCKWNDGGNPGRGIFCYEGGNNKGRVRSVALVENNLVGNIPMEISAWSQMTNLALRDNGPALSGPIPTEIGKLEKLIWLNFRNNGLTGTIPSEIGLLTNLQGLRLQGNNLDIDTIPANITALDLGTRFSYSPQNPEAE